MNTVEKSEDELYEEWLEKNEKFIKRYNKEHSEQQTLEYSKLYDFFEGLSHQQWLMLNRGHIYVELQELLRSMIPYFFNEQHLKR